MKLQETHELLAAASLIALRYREVNRDGHITLMEGLSFVQEIPEAIAAIKGADQLAAEILSLSESDLPELKLAVRDLLTAWGFGDQVGEVSTIIIDAALEVAVALVKLQSLK